MTCKACEAIGHTQCSFNEKFFSPEGWNCETLAKLRELVDPEQDVLPGRVQSRFVEDDRIAIILTHGVPDLEEYSFFLTLAWYKDRGRTDGAWLLLKDEVQPRRPTEAECLRVIQTLEQELAALA